MNLVRIERWSLGIGIVAAIACALDTRLRPADMLGSYLVAYVFCLEIAVGCLVLAMLVQLVGGRWGFAIAPVLEAGTATLPLLLVLLVPLALGMGELYPWTREPMPGFLWRAVESAGLSGLYETLWPATQSSSPAAAQRAHYLNVPFMLLRAVLFFAAWLVLGRRVGRIAKQRRLAPEDPEIVGRAQRLSAGGIVLVALTFSFFAVDWVMSLEPEWYSTIFGAMLATGGALSALSIGIVFSSFATNDPPRSGLSPQVLHDLGNLLLAFVMLWAYMAFSQFLVIWSGNLPVETTWYARRSTQGWQWLAAAVFALHFAVPFVLLLSRDVKRNPRGLACLAGGLLGVHYFELIWLVMPSLSPDLDWSHAAVPVALAGIWLGWFARKLRRRLEQDARYATDLS